MCNNCEFIISMITATTLLSITLPLSKILQSVKCDLSEAVKHAETVLSEVKDTPYLTHYLT